jgi:hypothetical protein
LFSVRKKAMYQAQRDGSRGVLSVLFDVVTTVMHEGQRGEFCGV